MTKKTTASAVVTEFRLTASRAQAIIRETAKDSDDVIFGDHAQERMEERDFTDLDILGALRAGIVHGGF